MMFERFTATARAAVVEAQEHARRLGHRYIGCEHLLLAVASAGEPAGAVLREHGVTAEGVQAEIVRLVGRGKGTSLFSAADRAALASIGIDLDAVRARLEAAFGPGAFARAVQAPRREDGAARRKNPVARLVGRRRPRCNGGRAGSRPVAGGHIPFTARAKKCLAHSVQEARARQDDYIGVQHLALALLAMKDGAVPPILAALGASPATMRAAIADRHRQAG